MNTLREFFSRLRAPFLRRRLEAEMAEEMRLHVELLTQKSIADGLPPEEARFAAQRRFGGAEQFKEQCRDGMRWNRLEDLLRDVRFAIRVLRKNLGLTTVAMLTLALCIGATTTIFSLVYTLLLKPLPFPEPNRIVEIRNVFDSKALESNLVQYDDYKAQAASYAAVGLWRLKPFTTGDTGSEERISAASCTAEMFDILE